MDLFFLATKLRIPPEPHHAIRRTRLIDALENGIAAYRLTLISAPAGYGKTTLLTQWAHSSNFPIGWLSLSREDNDLARFLQYLLKTWEEVQPEVKQSKLGRLRGMIPPDTDAVISAFINTAHTVSSSMVFVLDDFQVIEETSIHQALSYLIGRLPRTFHFVLAGRTEPPLPIARYRTHDILLEFRADDLRFLQEETTDFLNDLMKLDLSEHEVTQLQVRLEGWIAGLQLVALSRQRRLIGSDQLIVSGRHRFIADFLSEDVLAPLEAAKHQFLLQTSILDRLCGPLCDAVTTKENSQTMLETLERDNLFLVALDDSRQWFRYHLLFADYLQEELKRNCPSEVSELHRRAARWYMDHNLPDPAIHHAVEGRDPEIVIQIFDRYINTKLNGGEVRLVGQWVDALPAEWYSAYPVLGLARVGFLVFTGAFEAAFRYLGDIEQRLTPAKSGDLRWQGARVLALRCMMACVQNDISQAEVYAKHALQELSEQDLNWRPGVYAALGDVYRRNARWKEAKAYYLKALAVTESPPLRFLSVHVFGALADLALRQGRLKNAAGYWRKALVIIDEPDNWGRLQLPVTGWVYVRLGEMLYEWNELAEAWNYLSQGLEYAETGGDVRTLIASYLIAGRVKLMAGDIEAAAAYQERAQRLVEQAAFPEWTSRCERFQLELWLAQDELRAAVEWVDETLRSGGFEGRSESEVAQLAAARVLIAKGHTSSIDHAVTLLKGLFQAAAEEGRAGVQIETLALQSLAYWKRGDPIASMTALERSLRLAEPEGYVRLFVDLGLPMVRLLQEARSRAVMPEYVTTLLAAFGTDLALSTEAVLPEPLTRREQEILQLVAAGLTNLEIAEKLVISPETVKKHTGAIYGKLGVSNRTEAAARARTLDLLE
jgi:LuxR family transcriptional regulator, maltose regulon positive regulatory protein